MFEDGLVSFLFFVTMWAAWDFVSGLIDGLSAHDQLREDFKEQLRKIVHRVEAEIHKDTMYWFDEDSGEFLGQGTNVDECVAMVKEKFPKHMFYLYHREQDYLLSEGTEWKILKVELDK
jgi:hypothetical protein